MEKLRQALVVLTLFHLAGCATYLQTPDLLAQPPADMEVAYQIADLPFFPQEKYQCGPAALATVLNYQGIDVSPDRLVPLVYLPGKKGAFQPEIIAASRSLGTVVYTLDKSLPDLLMEVSTDLPVLVLQNLGLNSFPKWHFAVVKGFDLKNKTVILNSGSIENYQVSLATFERTWRRADYWAIAVTRPGELPVTAEADRYFLALADFQATNTDTAALNRAYEAAVSRWPGNHNLFMGYGNFLYQQKRLTHAAEIFRDLIAVDAVYGPAHNNLAHVLYELEDYEAAMSHAESAIQLDATGNPVFLNTYHMIADRLQELD